MTARVAERGGDLAAAELDADDLVLGYSIDISSDQHPWSRLERTTVGVGVCRRRFVALCGEGDRLAQGRIARARRVDQPAHRVGRWRKTVSSSARVKKPTAARSARGRFRDSRALSPPACVPARSSNETTVVVSHDDAGDDTAWPLPGLEGVQPSPAEL